MTTNGVRPPGEPQKRTEADYPRKNDGTEKELGGDRVESRNQEHPQGMRVDLHPLADVPHETMAVDRIDDSAKGDIGVIDEPSIGQHDETQKGDTQPFADTSHATAFSFAILRIIVPHCRGICVSKCAPSATVATRRPGATTAGQASHPTVPVVGAGDENPTQR